MPIYEYKCPKCGKVVERIELNPTTAVQPHCYHKDERTVYVMKRITSASNAHFKGTGFYATDYKGKS